MIFVTIGHQMPFDRLLRIVDDWAALRKRSDLFAQTGESTYVPKNFPSQPFLKPDEFRHKVQSSSAMVAHAGVGTIISALQAGKPLLVYPRLERYRETRNDHQVPTAKYFVEKGYLMAAYEEQELLEKIDLIEAFRPSITLGGSASPGLIERVRSFVFDGR
ncbi:hypothetical protein L6R52_43440 [Myxococcota bacterium]|nr:hypothetical protein [Myxococcota bacterium]